MERGEAGRTKGDVEDDGHQRKGTVWTATAHCITAVIGSGVLALAWSVAQLGWIVGPIALVFFAATTYYTSILLANCYRFPNPVTGSRNYTYMDAVGVYLGPRHVLMCGIAQYANLCGTLIGYTITSAIGMMEVMRSNCFHKYGHTSGRCKVSGNLYIIGFGVVQIVLSQLPNLDKVTLLSVVAAAMSFAYSIISLCLCIAKWVSHGDIRGTLMGGITINGGTFSAAKTWNVLQALGNIALAFNYSVVMIEIQDTLKSPPSENITMKRATRNAIGITTLFYTSLGCIGYAAFGTDTPGNILTGFYEPFWLVDIANICIVIHLLGAYQVYAQPIFASAEKKIASKWPTATFVHTVHTIRIPFINANFLSFTLSKLILRSAFVTLSTLVAMIFPFFNAMMGLLGALGFWPLTVYFPVNMFIVQAKIKRGMLKWNLLQSLCLVCLLVSIFAAIGSVVEIVNSLKRAKLFRTEF